MENFSNLLNAFGKATLFFQSFLEELPCDITDPRDFCINSILEMLRGTNFSLKDLLEKKSLKDSQILIRAQIERFIKLKKLCDDPTFAKSYIDETQRNRLKYIKMALENAPEAKNNPLYDSLKKVVTQDDLKALEQEVAKNGPEISIWELARQTGLLHEYYLPYRFYSDPVHAASSELDDCFIKKGEEIILIPYGANKQEELPITLMFAMHVLLEAASITAQFKKINIEETLKDLRIIPGHWNQPTADTDQQDFAPSP